MNPALQSLKPYPMVQLAERKAQLREQGVRLFDFGTGDPIEPTPTFIPEALKKAVPEISQYPSVAGTAALREAIADYLHRRFTVTLDPTQNIIPSAGSKEAVFHLPLAFLDPSTGIDTVIYGTPAYPVYETGCLFAGGKTHPITLSAASGWQLDLTKVAGDVLKRTGICWLNYPHNPTGAGVDLNYLNEQAACAAEHDILLVADECYADLWFDDASHPPSILQTQANNILAIHSCSKRSGMTGYRSGFTAGPSPLIARYRRWRAPMGVGSPTFIEAAATAAWSDDEHVAQRRAVFSAKRSVLRDGLRAKGIDVADSPAGLYIWARVPGDGNADAYAQRCLDAGIIISPGAFFGPGGDGWFRLALVPSIGDCERALACWPQN